MTDSAVLEIALQTMVVALKLSAPILVPALVIGFAISLVQSMTQIQEFTLAFVPKLVGVGIALLISGVVITETVFNIPGLGRLTVDAVLKRDYPVVQGLILVFAGAKVLVNLVIDISYAFLDPRIRY